MGFVEWKGGGGEIEEFELYVMSRPKQPPSPNLTAFYQRMYCMYMYIQHIHTREMMARIFLILQGSKFYMIIREFLKPICLDRKSVV